MAQSKFNVLLRSSATLVLVEGVERISGFLRSIIIARLIGPEQFGIASLFVLTVALFEMMSGFAPDVLMIQDDEGDNERLQSNIQAFQLIRGISLAVLIFVSADLVAALFNVREAAWAFRVLSVVPLLKGCTHLDLKRLQRNLDFSLYAKVSIGSSLLILVLAVPFAFYLRNYAAMLAIVRSEERRVGR